MVVKKTSKEGISIRGQIHQLFEDTEERLKISKKKASEKYGWKKEYADKVELDIRGILRDEVLKADTVNEYKSIIELFIDSEDQFTKEAIYVVEGGDYNALIKEIRMKRKTKKTEDKPGQVYTRKSDGVTLKRAAIWLREGQLRDLKLIAAASGETVSEIIQTYLDSFIEMYLDAEEDFVEDGFLKYPVFRKRKK